MIYGFIHLVDKDVKNLIISVGEVGNSWNAYNLYSDFGIS